MPQHLLRALSLAVAIGSGSCERAQKAADSPIPPGTSPLTKRIPLQCHIHAPSACRVGCDAEVPKKIIEVAPDLSGLDVTGLNGVEIVEILVDVHGDVQEACLLRGVREDVDRRAIAAIRQWRFEPARHRHSTPPRLPIRAVITVTLRIGMTV
jgi:TonB family protein